MTKVTTRGRQSINRVLGSQKVRRLLSLPDGVSTLCQRGSNGLQGAGTPAVAGAALLS